MKHSRFWTLLEPVLSFFWFEIFVFKTCRKLHVHDLKGSDKLWAKAMHSDVQRRTTQLARTVFPEARFD